MRSRRYTGLVDLKLAYVLLVIDLYLLWFLLCRLRQVAVQRRVVARFAYPPPEPPDIGGMTVDIVQPDPHPQLPKPDPDPVPPRPAPDPSPDPKPF